MRVSASSSRTVARIFSRLQSDMPFRPFSTENPSRLSNLPADSSDNILVEEKYGVRTAILNRPKALNALNTPMVVRLKELYQEWEVNPDVSLIVLKANGRAFCAGGDVRSVYNYGIAGDLAKGREFFWNEYQLNYLIGTIKKPHVAIMNGICMGGGNGISTLGTFRVVTENCLFAMPETAIALHPDVGASFFLPRLPGRLGEFLALTGMKLDADDMMKVGLATHAVPSYRLAMLEQRLANINTSDLETIHYAILEHAATPELSPTSPLHKRELIDEVFGLSSVENIISALEKKVEQGEEWCQEPLNKLKYASPTSLKVTLRSVREGRNQDIAQCLQREYRLSVNAIHSVTTSDFYEGVRALLVDKDNKPKWNPESLSQVTPKMVDAHFKLLPESEELVLPRKERESSHGSAHSHSRL